MIRRFLPATRALAAVAAFASVAAFAGAQGAVRKPYTIEVDGVLQGIGWDVEGGQPATASPLRKNRYLSMTTRYSLYENNTIFAWLAQNLAGPLKPFSCVVSRVGPRQTTDAIGTFSTRVTNMVPTVISFPGGNSAMHETADVVVQAEPDKVEADPAYAANPNGTMIARKAKAWMVNNYEVHPFMGINTSRVSQFDPLVLDLVSGGDLDGDGAPDYTFRCRDVGFLVPAEDAAPFMEEFSKAQAGSPTVFPFTVRYLDPDGIPLMTVSLPVTIVSVGPSDIFVNTAMETKKPPVKVTVRHELKGHVTLIK